MFSAKHLLGMCHDLWLAGQETTGTTLSWGIGYLIDHPEVQQRCHAELDAVVGSSRRILIEDRSSLPYLNACINVSVRYKCGLSVAHMGRFHDRNLATLTSVLSAVKLLF